MEHVLRGWAEVCSRLKDRFLFLCLDYDGTLSPIAATPRQAVLHPKVRELLKRLSGHPRCQVAVISGRALEDVKKKIGLNNIIYSGNHGLEIEGPRIKFKIPLSLRYKNILEQVKKEMGRRIAPFKGAFIEDKGAGLTLHFRLVRKTEIPLVKAAFHETVIHHLIRDEIRIRSGKMVLEVRPVSEWDKGKVVLWLLARQRFIWGAARVVPVYLGDDITDEDVFKALEGIGITVFVGRPKASRARYYLDGPGEVRKFLKKILGILGRKSV